MLLYNLIFLLSFIAISVRSQLYSFSAHTFTNAGATGRLGPTLAQVQLAYSSQTWATTTEFLTMTTQGIQLWTVPYSGTYQITVAGASGGTAINL